MSRVMSQSGIDTGSAASELVVGVALMLSHMLLGTEESICRLWDFFLIEGVCAWEN